VRGAPASALLLAALALFPAAAAAAPPPTPATAAPAPAFALVVGVNRPPRTSLPTLRYADDDAVRWAVLLQTLGARVEVLAELDAESRRLYGDTVPPLHPPTADALAAAMDRLRRAMAEARAGGARPTFYFVYAGHGDADGAGEGYVTLSDGRFFRRDLEAVVLAGSPAHANHIIVDACRSYYFVYDRGPGGTRRPFRPGYFASGTARRYPNTGFLLSSSSDAPSHEWEEFQAGVFSHEVRSAFLGGADANGDHRVDYRELAAFLEVVNHPVRNARYRPAFAVNPPLSGEKTILDLAGAVGGAVHLPAGADGRRLLEDPLGVRWADLHPGPSQAITLRLPRTPWAAPELFLRRTRDDHEYRVPAGGRSSLAQLAGAPARALRRGAAHEAFTQLFAEPFDQAAVAALPPPSAGEAGLITQAPAAPPSSLPRALPWLTLGAGAVAAGASGLLLWQAHTLRDEHSPGDTRPALNRRIANRNQWAAVTGVAGGVLLGAGALLLLRPEAPARAPAPWSATIAPLPGGLLAGVSITR
jgi:hypothetical protein